MIVQIMKYYKIIISIILIIFGMVFGYVVKDKIDSIKIGIIKKSLNECKNNLEGCMEAYRINNETITKLKKELESSNRSCQQKIEKYKKMLKEIKNIDELKGEVKDEKNNNSSCNDDICDYLNRVWK